MSRQVGRAEPELAGQAVGDGPAMPSPRYRIAVFAVAAAVLAADAISKALVVTKLAHPPGVRLLGGLLVLLETRNSGAAFSFGPSLTALYALIAVGVAVTIARMSRRIGSMPWAVAFGLLLGGATGNLADRLLRGPSPMRGWVVDWIWLPHFPPFNLADSAITIGAVLFVLLVLTGRAISAAPARSSTAS